MRSLLAALGLVGGLLLSGCEADQPAVLDALQSPDSLLIDVRTAEEFAAGALPGAQRIGHEEIAKQIASLAPDLDTPIVLYCRSGRRSALAEASLRDLGYRNLINAGGYSELIVALENRK